MFERELQRGSTELVVLTLIAERDRHAFEIGELIRARSGGRLTSHISTLYPVLYQLEERGWIEGRSMKRLDERCRRYYRLTEEGRTVLARQREHWQEFVDAIRPDDEATGGSRQAPRRE